MSSYDEQLIVGTETPEEKKDTIPDSLFYSSMNEEDKLRLLNDLASQVELLRRDTTKSDTRSVEDQLFNRNSFDPGHTHTFPPGKQTIVFANFESLDGWTLGGTGTEVITNYVGGVKLATGTSSNDTAFIQAVATGFNSFDVSQTSTFQTLVSLGSTTSQTIYFGVGNIQAGAANPEGYGFKVSGSTLSSLTVESGTESLTTLNNITLTNFNEYRAVFTTGVVKFYVNGQAVASHATRVPDTDNDTYGLFHITTTTTASRNMSIKYFYFQQLNT